MAVGVVKDGKVVLCEGYGLRDTAGKLPATGETLYQIGSCSKAFTAALVSSWWTTSSWGTRAWTGTHPSSAMCPISAFMTILPPNR